MGTMIDDLCTKELFEPYRVLTSRSEYRLLLRADNADARMTPIGREMGLVDDHRWSIFTAKQDRIETELKRLSKTRVVAGSESGDLLCANEHVTLKQSATLSEVLRQPGVTYADMRRANLNGVLRNGYECERVETEVKYEGYIRRQADDIERSLKKLGKVIRPDLNYEAVKGLRREAQEKLDKIRPETLGQASRIGGVNPADIAVLSVYLEKVGDSQGCMANSVTAQAQ